MKIGIIGGGWMGLVTAYRLSGPEREITIFERENQLGGLATYADYGDFFWDRFYHVILPADRALLDFITEIGLGDAIRWKQTLTGVYVDEHFYSVSNTKEFLQFPPLNLFQKFRLGLTILIGSRIKDWRRLETITVEDWLIKYSGRTTYEKFWKPLLLAKLGESYQRVSAVFIWTYIKRLFEARETSSARKEQMGYVSGGYKTLFDHLQKQLHNQGARFRMNTTVESVTPHPDGGLWLTADGETAHFDKIVFTGPVNVLHRIAEESLTDIRGDHKAVEYLGVICMVLVLKKNLTPYYVLNIADERIPFTGVIGMSALVDPAETGGHYLVYLPKYVLSGDPMLKKPDEEIKSLFFEGLHQMYPGFSTEDILSVHIHRAFKVQPLQVLNYSEIVPRVSNLHPDFYVLNTSQFVNDTLNNNSVTRHVNRFIEQYGEQFATTALSHP
jgi:protoporphyrinogen oxidase